MIRFVDGPACGASLSLRRAPIFLRAVIGADGGVDALDQLDDQARPDESIYAYRLHGEVGSFIACSRGKGGCQTGLAAQYRLCADQPADAVLRNNERWAEWARQQYEREYKRLISINTVNDGNA